MTNQGHSYLILGAGKQGLAAAYDAIQFGGAGRLTLADSSRAFAERGKKRLQQLCFRQIRKNRIQIIAARLDARHPPALNRLLNGHDAVLSALPYYLNPAVAEAAVNAGVHYCDLGGYFE